MKPEKQRIAIAELLGYKFDAWIGKPKHVFGWLKDGQYISVLPDFLHDLNAVSVAEDFLIKRIVDQQHYASPLYKIMDEPARYCEIVYRATPAQRTKALLITFKKWED